MHESTGATCNGSCECANENGSEDGCTKIIDFNTENDGFILYNQLSLECKDGKCLCADRFYQRFTNVCRRESIQNETACNNFVDYSVELNSIGAESNCTSVGTQTHSRDANIQTTQSLESLDTPSELNDKFSLFSSKRVRNYINYNRLDNSDCTKAESSLESSVKDESTQFGESGDSENKYYNGHRYPCFRKFYCYCQDPFYPKDLNKPDITEDEIYFEHASFNPKAHRCICKGEHYCPVEIRRNYLRRQQLGLNSLYTQATHYRADSFCPCFPPSLKNNNNNFTEHCKETNERFTKKFNENFYKVNSNDRPQQNTCECKLNFNAQHITEATKMQFENNTLNDGAFDSAGYKVEILNEKANINQFADSFVAVADDDRDKNCLEKESDDVNFIEDNEQSKPLLGQNDNQAKSSNDSIAAESEKEGDEVEASAGHGCHCHHHHHHDNSPESNNLNCIRVRPSRKKSSKSTSPLKIITLLLFASAFIITGSAIRDAYYP